MYFWYSRPQYLKVSEKVVLLCICICHTHKKLIYKISSTLCPVIKNFFDSPSLKTLFVRSLQVYHWFTFFRSSFSLVESRFKHKVDRKVLLLNNNQEIIKNERVLLRIAYSGLWIEYKWYCMKISVIVALIFLQLWIFNIKIYTSIYQHPLF